MEEFTEEVILELSLKDESSFPGQEWWWERSGMARLRDQDARAGNQEMSWYEGIVGCQRVYCS